MKICQINVLNNKNFSGEIDYRKIIVGHLYSTEIYVYQHFKNTSKLLLLSDVKGFPKGT